MLGTGERAKAGITEDFSLGDQMIPLTKIERGRICFTSSQYLCLWIQNTCTHNEGCTWPAQVPMDFAKKKKEEERKKKRLKTDSAHIYSSPIHLAPLSTLYFTIGLEKRDLCLGEAHSHNEKICVTENLLTSSWWPTYESKIQNKSILESNSYPPKESIIRFGLCVPTCMCVCICGCVSYP